MKKTRFKFIIVCMLVIGAFVFLLNNGVIFDEDVMAAEGSDSVQFYNGHECVPQQVIIVYETNDAAKKSADMILNSNAEFEIIGNTDDQLESKVPADDSESRQSNQENKDESGSENSLVGQAAVMEAKDNMLVVEVNPDVALSDYMNEAMSEPGVAYVQPNYIYTITADVNDPIANMNSNYYGWHLHTIEAFSAWDYTYGSNVVVGVIDTGVDLDHPDLAANILAHTDTADDDGSADDADGHGTMVCGLIAALTNDIGSCGIAPNASLVVADAFYSSTQANSQDLLEAVNYMIAQDVDIINMSFGGPGSADTVLNNAITEAYNQGIVVIASAGNENTDTANYPSDLDSVIGVMASTIDDDFLWYDSESLGSNYGAAKDITAPGVLVASTNVGGGYAAWTGTSCASPITAGTAALMLSLDNTLTPDEVANILYSTTANTCTQILGGSVDYGAGRLDAGAAVAYVYNNLRVASVDVSPESEVIDHSETLMLTTTITPSNAVNKNVSYSSNDETIATVDSTGLVTPHISNNGTAIITATSEDGGHTDICTVTVVDVKVIGVDIVNENQIDVGEILSIAAIVTPSNATNKNVVYISSDESIATVDASGNVEGIAMGTATITVTTEEGDFTDNCTLKVGYPVESVLIDDGQMDIGQTHQLTPAFTPSNATNKNVTYESSNTDIVTVDESGLVTGIAFGTVTITVTAEDGGHTDTCTIISGYHVESVSLSPETMEIPVGGNDQVTTDISPNNATNQNVSYSSSDESVVLVDAVGVVWAQSVGTATVTVTTEEGGHTDTTIVTVVQPVQEVVLHPEVHYMLVSDTLQLQAVVLPENASNKKVTYSSADELVATVDSTGLVTSVGLGKTIITATTEDGSFTDTCSVNVVEEIIVSSIYTVNRINRFFEDVAIGTSVQEIIDSINNSIGTVYVYNNAMEPVTEGLVSTGYYIQLDISGDVADEVRILIEGDCNPDTILDIIDYTLIRLHILNVSQMTGISLEAADVNNDGAIDIIDYTLVRLHILNVLPLY